MPATRNLSACAPLGIAGLQDNTSSTGQNWLYLTGHCCIELGNLVQQCVMLFPHWVLLDLIQETLVQTWVTGSTLGIAGSKLGNTGLTLSNTGSTLANTSSTLGVPRWALLDLKWTILSG
jgi:hypothetical protein